MRIVSTRVIVRSTCLIRGCWIDIEKMKMWEPLQRLLTSSTSTEGVQTQTLWVIGTALQNNPSAQSSVRMSHHLTFDGVHESDHNWRKYLSLSPMPTLLSFLDPSNKSGKLRSKAIYTLSGLLKHNSAAVRQFQDAGGWGVLKAALEGN